MGNSAKLGRSFADFRNVCIFALPMRLKINRMFPARHAIRKQRTCSYGMKAEQEPVGEQWSDGRVAEAKVCKTLYSGSNPLQTSPKHRCKQLQRCFYFKLSYICYANSINYIAIPVDCFSYSTIIKRSRLKPYYLLPVRISESLYVNQSIVCMSYPYFKSS